MRLLAALRRLRVPCVAVERPQVAAGSAIAHRRLPGVLHCYSLARGTCAPSIEMGNKRKPAYYAVRVVGTWVQHAPHAWLSLSSKVKIGRKPGIYTTWEETKSCVHGFKGAQHKGFASWEDADAWLNDGAANSAAAAAAAAYDDGAGGGDRARKQRRLEGWSDVGGRSAGDASDTGRGRGRAAGGAPPTRRADPTPPPHMGDHFLERKHAADGPESAGASADAFGDGRGAACEAGEDAAGWMAMAARGLADGGDDDDAAACAAAEAVEAAGIDPSRLYQMEFDGAARGNPGRSGCGAVLREADSGREIAAVCYDLQRATNNQAEYCALLLGLQAAAALGIQRLHVLGDSKLVVQQVNGVWGLNNDTLRTLCSHVGDAKKQFKAFTLGHVFREGNKRADELSNVAIDTGGWEGVRVAGGPLLPLPREPDLRALVRDGLAAAGK